MNETKIDIISGIVDWNKERMLDQQNFDPKVENINCVEEIIECYQLSSGEPIKSEVSRKISQEIIDEIDKYLTISNDKEVLVDSFADRIVYSIGAILKLGYDPQKVMEEVFKEISSRTGEIIDGKFVKDQSPEAKARWYKANFKNAEINQAKDL